MAQSTHITDARPVVACESPGPGWSSLVAEAQSLVECVAEQQPTEFVSDPRWLMAVCQGLRHSPYIITARQDDRLIGFLPLALVRSLLFGRYLVSLPYVNSAGVVAERAYDAQGLVDRAVHLANALRVRYLELRQESRVPHQSLGSEVTSKVQMRLPLPDREAALWDAFKPKVRNQIRKAERHRLQVAWGGEELLDVFHRVFSVNMRDLGTPVFGKRLYANILRCFGDEAELCCVHLQGRPVAAALLVHGAYYTEVPSASCLRTANYSNANMWMYWQLLQRAIQRGSRGFDFGRTSEGSNTHRFKKQWGALPAPTVWQYYVRAGAVSDMRPDNEKYQPLIRTWRRLPVWLTRWIGPPIVRGIP